CLKASASCGAGATNRVATERARNSRDFNARVRFLSLSVAQVIFRKVHRFSFRKMLRFQAITNSVLNPRSTELWRRMAGESEFWVSGRVSECRGLPTNIGVY